MKEALLTFHILGVALWLGGVGYSVVTFHRHARLSSLKDMLSVDQAVGAKYFGTAFALVIVSGIGLVVDSATIGWGTAFVLVGFGVVIATTVIETAVVGPRLTRMAESGDNDIDGATRIIGFSGLLQFLLLGFAIWAMVVHLGL